MTETVQLSRGEVEGLTVGAFEAAGLPHSAARDAAEILVLGEMMGITTHGLGRVAPYIKRIIGGGINPTANFVTDAVGPALLRVDGDNGLGAAVARHALRVGMVAAKETGIAAVFCRHSNHFAAAAPYCLIAAQAGFAALIMSNSTALMAPTGGREARIGNNPFGFGFPGPDGAHILFDMAISVAARSHVRAAQRADQPIPKGWATDAEGHATTNAKAALHGLLLPIGGHKGYGLALTVDLLAGVLSGASFLNDVPDLQHQPNAVQDLGQTLILIDTTKMMSPESHDARLRHLRRVLTQTPPIDPAIPVRLPGDRALDRLAQTTKSGIPLSKSCLTDLKRLARQNAIHD